VKDKQLAVEKNAEQKVKEQNKKDAAAQQKQKENDREQQGQACMPNAPFTGSLSSKSKPDLQKIVGVLFLLEGGDDCACLPSMGNTKNNLNS
jgi:hypothetical protein